MRSWLRKQLELAWWEVTEAEDGRSALDRFGDDAPDVVLLDEHMPAMKGLEVAREIRSRNAKVTLLLFSASVAADVIAEADRLSVHFMSKINLELILKHLEFLYLEYADS